MLSLTERSLKSEKHLNLIIYFIEVADWLAFIHRLHFLWAGRTFKTRPNLTSTEKHQVCIPLDSANNKKS